MNRRDQRQAKKRKEREERHRQRKHEERSTSARDSREADRAIARALANLKQREEAFAATQGEAEERPIDLLSFAYDQALRVISHRLGREATLREPETAQFMEHSDATEAELAGTAEDRESAALLTAEVAWQVASIDEEAALDLAQEALSRDSACFLAAALVGELEASNASDAIAKIQKARELAEVSLGSAFFEEHRGEFSTVRRGRAYLRLLRTLAWLNLNEADQHGAAEAISRLHSADEHGHFGAYHFGVVQMLLAPSPDAKTLETMHAQLEPESDPTEAWLCCALEYQRGNRAEARQHLLRANHLNSYFSRVWLGVLPEEVEKLGEEAPFDFDFSEAMEILRIVQPLATHLAGFDSWLRQELFGEELGPAN